MNDIIFKYQSYVPPKGYKITREATYEERKHIGRKIFASVISLHLRRLAVDNQLDTVSICSYGDRYSIVINKDAIYYSSQSRSNFWGINSQTRVPFSSDKKENTVADWLMRFNPYFGARLLKVVQKQVRDKKAKANNKPNENRKSHGTTCSW